MKLVSGIFVVLLASSLCAVAEEKPKCHLSDFSKVDNALFRQKFDSRYCKKRKKAKCDQMWNNFLQLLDNIEADRRIKNVGTAAYLLATAYLETYSGNFSPTTKEQRGAVNDGQPYWKRDPETGQSYFGRGWVQLTWKDKYEKAKKIIGLDFINDPDLALETKNSYEILFRSMTEGWLEQYRSTAKGEGGTTSIRLGDFISEESVNYDLARTVINANCNGNCTTESRQKIGDKGYIPFPNFIDSAQKGAKEARFFEEALCSSIAP